MPQVLTMTQKPDESTEEFAARIAEQADALFRGAEAASDETPEPTDVSAEPETAEEEPAPTA